MKLSFAVRWYWSIKLIGEMNKNIKVLIDLTNLPKRPGIPAKISEENLTNDRSCGLNKSLKLLILFPSILNPNKIIDII